MFREMEAAGQPEPKYRTVEYMVKATLWQHSMVSVSLKLDPIGGKLDPIGEKEMSNSLYITSEVAERYLFLFDKIIAPKFKRPKNVERVRNYCWKIILCMLENNEVSHSNISVKTGIALSSLKVFLRYMKEAGMVNFVGANRGGKWLVKIWIKSE